MFIVCLPSFRAENVIVDTYHSNPEKPSPTQINKRIASGYSLFTHCWFDNIKYNHDYYRGRDCIRKFSEDLKEHAAKIINYEKKMK